MYSYYLKFFKVFFEYFNFILASNPFDHEYTTFGPRRFNLRKSVFGVKMIFNDFNTTLSNYKFSIFFSEFNCYVTSFLISLLCLFPYNIAHSNNRYVNFLGNP